LGAYRGDQHAFSCLLSAAHPADFFVPIPLLAGAAKVESEGNIPNPNTTVMAKTRAKKQSEVAVITQGLKDAKTVVFADLSKLKVADSTELRRKAKKENINIVTAKKTLLRVALKEAGITTVDADSFKGSVALLLGLGDEIAPAKVFEAFRKDRENVALLGGLFQSRLMTAEEVKTLSKLPSKAELISRVIGSLNAPLSGLVNVLQGNLRGLVYALNAIKDSKQA